MLEDADTPDAISSGLLWLGGVSPASLSPQYCVAESSCIHEQPIKPPAPSPEPFPPVSQGVPHPQFLSCRQRTLHLHRCLPAALPLPSSPPPCPCVLPSRRLPLAGGAEGGRAPLSPLHRRDATRAPSAVTRCPSQANRARGLVLRCDSLHGPGTHSHRQPVPVSGTGQGSGSGNSSGARAIPASPGGRFLTGLGPTTQMAEGGMSSPS